MIRFLPTRRLALLIALVAPVWAFSGSRAGLIVALFLTVLVVSAAMADAMALPARRQIEVRRKLPEKLGLGDNGSADYEIRSAWPLPLTLELHDALVHGVRRTDAVKSPAGAPWRIGRVRVHAHELRRFSTRLIGDQRGKYPLGRVVVRAIGPLGLMQRSLEYQPGGQLTVVPSVAGIRRYRLLALQHRLREAGIRVIRRRGEGSSFANLREYVIGDDPRRVDWKATARRGKLITREYSIEQGQTVIIAIDAGRMMTQLSGEISRFEHALASASVLADVATRSGDHVGLLVFNDEVRAFVPPARGVLAVHRIRDAMVPLFPNTREPDYAAAFRTLATRHRKRSLVVLFTDVVDPRASRALIAHTARSAARHLPLVVALRNDALATAALPGTERADSLFHSAAAEELLLEREEALARMRRAGVSVLDVSPQVMSAAVVNRYLAIKARASL